MIVQCELCPKMCLIEPGQSGECRIRVNVDGRLTAVSYGHPCAVHVDPIEKKPLFHFLPGTQSFSIATVGCNLHCKNCQNWEISQKNPEDGEAVELPPESLPDLARQYDCRSVAYTYTDPVVYYEYAMDCAIQAREAGLKNALITAGYINREPWEKLCGRVDAARIDLKSYSDKFYRDICGATLMPVLDSLAIARKLGVHLEVINLLIPTLNDSDKDLHGLCQWMSQNLGPEVPLHFSRFFPNYKMTNLPPTPRDALLRAREIAKSEGLHYVYVGNMTVPDGGNTFCPQCGTLIVERRGFAVLQNRVRDGRCPDCQKEIYGVWQ